MQQPRGERSHGANPADIAGGERAGTAEPISLVDLDGAVTRIAPGGIWTREQVRHPGDEPLFITRLERGQLWHRASQRSGGSGKAWTHEVQVGPATVVSARGQFHVVAEPDGGATISCLEGQVAVATQVSSPLLLERDESVAVAADGAAIVVTDPAAVSVVPRRGVGRAQPVATARSPIGSTLRRVGALAARPYVVASLLALVALLLVVLIVVLVFDRGGGSGSLGRPPGYPWAAEVLR